MIKVFLYLAPIYALAIIYFSLGENHMPPVDLNHADKLYHSGAYFLMTVLWYVFFYVRVELKNYKASLELYKQQTGGELPIMASLREIFSSFSLPIAIGSAILSMIMGLLLELGQGFFTENREMDLNDVFANTGGIIIALALLYVIGYRWNPQKSKSVN